MHEYKEKFKNMSDNEKISQVFNLNLGSFTKRQRNIYSYYNGKLWSKVCCGSCSLVILLPISPNYSFIRNFLKSSRFYFIYYLMCTI